MIPKNMALAAPERSALILGPALVVCARATSWLIGTLRAVTDALLRAVHVEPKEELASAFTAEEVYAIVTESRREGLIAQESTLLTGALELSQRNAVDVMVPWDQVVTVVAGSSPQDVERLVGRTGYSRFPVVPHGGSRDLVGYLHLKDLLYADDERYTEPVPAGRVRALVSVGAQADIEDVLAALQRSGAHLARVIEDGGPGIPEETRIAAEAPIMDSGQTADHTPRTVGVVFLEDVLEELVGEVRDATQRSGALLEAARMSHPT
jgi:CBS domain containing-hemolysin-like protein